MCCCRRRMSLCCSVGLSVATGGPDSGPGCRSGLTRAPQCRVLVRWESGNRKLSAVAAEERSQLAEKCWPVVLFIAGSEAAS